MGTAPLPQSKKIMHIMASFDAELTHSVSVVSQALSRVQEDIALWPWIASDAQSNDSVKDTQLLRNKR